MNINKKYKKWLLGLVTPVLALAPMVLISSCSNSSNQEKTDYGIWFKRSKDDNPITIETNKHIDSYVELKQEIINNKEKVFNFKGNENILTDQFLNTNLHIISSDNFNQEYVQVRLLLNNADSYERNDWGIFILKHYPFQLANLSQYQYKIDFTPSASGKSEINLNDKLISNTLPSLWLKKRSYTMYMGLDLSYLLKLIVEDPSIKNQILTISGRDADKITNEILRKQIIYFSTLDFQLKSNDKKGTAELTLMIESPENGVLNPISKTFIFTGFDKLDNYTIWFDEEINENNIIEIDTELSSFTRTELKQEIINNKEKLFNNIKGNTNILTDEFLNANLDFTPPIWNGEVMIVINNASPEGGQIVTKFKLKYKQPNLSQYQYKIDFTPSASEKPEINLNDKLISNTLPSLWTNDFVFQEYMSLNSNYLVKLIVEDPSIKNQILTISGRDADKITNEVLRTIFNVSNTSNPNDKDGTLEVELKISSPDENGNYWNPIRKTFIFTGFRKL